MKKSKTKMLLGAALCLLAFAGQAQAQPGKDKEDKAVEALDQYFRAPRDPHTFRALTGMGDPVLSGAPSSYTSDWGSPADKMLLKQLMPALDITQPYFFPNFGDCRLEGPMMTLRARQAALGAGHPYVKQWLLVEHAVLAHCNDGKADLPPAMAAPDANIARLQERDRAYQQAAMLFYRNTEAALAAFQAIAQDKNSPNRPLAAYMVLAIHAGNKGSYEAQSAALKPADAIAEIHAALADPSLAPIHAMAAALVGYIGATVADGPARHAQIGEALQALEVPTQKLAADPVARTRYFNALTDMPFIFGDGSGWGDRKREIAWVLTGKLPDDYTASAALADFARTDPLAAWIGFPGNPFAHKPWAVAEQMPLPPVVRHYLQAHAQNQTTNPWVHESQWTPLAARAAMANAETARLKADPADAQAAAALAFDFPELIRRDLMEGGKAGEDDALARLQGFAFRPSSIHTDTANAALVYLITNNRLAAARRLRDLLKMDEGTGPGTGNVWDVDALTVLAEDENHLVKLLTHTPYYDRAFLNSLSTTELWRLAARSAFNRGERAMFARSAWTREYALSRTIGKDHDRLMRDLNPEITKSWRSPAGRDVTPDDRKVLADVLASPGMNITLDSFSRMPDGDGYQKGQMTGIDHYNHNDNNWWCGWETKLRGKQMHDLLQGTFSVYRYDDETPDYFAAIAEKLQPGLQAGFVRRMSDAGELAALSRVDCAPKMLALRTIAWVKHPGWFDAGDVQAEALANVVLASRYSCNREGSHKDYSQKAFTLLHVKFGETAAAKRTPYWFP